MRPSAKTLGRLRERARLLGERHTTLAERYLAEGVVMDEHPNLHFVDGAMGRRPAISGTGLDVWEVVQVARDNDGSVTETASYLEIAPRLVEAALRYYGENKDEVDDWIARVFEFNEREEQISAWRARGLLCLKLLLDEHLSPDIARQLRDRGHDVVAVSEEPGLRGRSDRAHFASLETQQRAIVTRDLGDYRPLLADATRRGSMTYGLVCLPRRFALNRAGIGRIVRALDALLRARPQIDAATTLGGEIWLEDPPEG